MGRKVHPLGFRLGIVKEHRSRWFATGKDYVDRLAEDREIRRMINERLPKAGISHIEIERQPNQVYVIINTAKPGIIIGRKGTTVNELRIELQDLTGKKAKIDVKELTKPEINAQFGGRKCRRADGAPHQLEARHEAGRTAGHALRRRRHHDHRGWASGRQRMGAPTASAKARMPRHTLRADIEHGTAEANTTYGVIGVKCWVYQGEVLPGEEYHSRYAEMVATE
ncbi:MAG: 30S ribosomal protein S3 [Caldilineaceae bacterium]